MASIDRRPNGRYRARWREYPTGPQQTRTFDRKADAQRFLDGVSGDLVRGVYVSPAGGRIKFQDYAEEWRAGQVHRPSTTVQIESYLRRHAYPTLGAKPLGSIRRADLQAWVKDRSGVLSPGSVELIYRWVSTIFKAAVADRLIPSTPCVGVKLPPRVKGEIVPLLPTQVECVADAIAPRYRALITFAAGTGMRQGECFGVTVDRIDFLRRQVRVDRQLLGVKGGTLEWGPPKSSAGFRTIPLPSVVTDALAAHLAEFGEGPDRVVFTNSFGGGLRRGPFNEMWHRATAETGLPLTTTSTTSATSTHRSSSRTAAR